MIQQPLYSWTVVTKAGDPPHLGALGISDDQQIALSALSGALRDAPAGSYGVVHRVMVGVSWVGYLYDAAVIRAELDPDSGAVLVDEVSEGEGPGRFNHPFDDWLQGLHGGAR